MKKIFAALGALAVILIVVAVVFYSGMPWGENMPWTWDFENLPWSKPEEEIDPTLNLHKIQYTLPNGDIKSVEVEMRKSYSIMVPQREGYIFKGLFDEEKGGVQFVGNNGLSVMNWNEAADKNLFAQWEPKSIQFVFDANGGTGADNTMTATYDATIGTFPTFTKAGHQFVGWFDGNGEDAAAYSDGMGIPTKPKMTYASYPTARGEDIVRLYAKWEANLISVKFNTNRSTIQTGLSSVPAEETVKIPYGSKIDAYIPTGSGFAKTVDTGNGIKGIVGWAQSKTGTTLFNEVITDSVTELFAVWAPAILFDMQGTMTVDALIENAGKEISLPTPNRDGYAFLGWKDASGKPFTEKTMPTEGAKVYPSWGLKTYTISYQVNGGTEIENAPTEYTVETSKFTLPTPTKEHYQFNGWYRSADFSGNAVARLGEGVGITGDLELHAKWIPIQYSITYNLNGGQMAGAVTNYTVETPKFTLPTPQKDYYIFEGWYMNEECSGNEIRKIDPKNEFYGDLELFSKWKIEEISAIQLNMEPRSCKNDNGYNVNDPLNDYVANNEIDKHLCDLILNGCISNGDSYIIDNSKFVLGLKVLQDPQAIGVTHIDGSGVKKAEISVDTATSAVNTNINKKIERGAVYIRIEYIDKSSTEGFATNIFGGKTNGSYIDILSITGVKIDNNKKIESITVDVVYEILAWWQGFLGIWEKTLTNWRAQQVLKFE